MEALIKLIIEIADMEYGLQLDDEKAEEMYEIVTEALKRLEAEA